MEGLFKQQKKWRSRILPILILIASLWLAADSIRLFWADRIYPTIPYFEKRLLPPTLDPREQIKRLERAIRIHPYPPSFYFMELGKRYEVLMRQALMPGWSPFLSSRMDAELFGVKAVACYEEAIRRSPTDAYAHMALAWVLENGSTLPNWSRTEDAARAMNNAASLSPHDPSVQYSAGYFWFLRAASERDEKTRQEALGKYPALFLKAFTLDERLQDAILSSVWERSKVIAELEKVVPKSAQGQILLARFLDRQRLWSESKKVLAAALKAFPNNGALSQEYTGLLEAHGEVAAAAEQWERIRESSPKSPETYQKLAYLYGRLGNHEEVIAKVKQLISLDSSKPDYALALAQAYKAAGKDKEAVDAYMQLLARFPKYAEGHFVLAQYQMEKNRIPEAVDHLLQAISLDGRNFQYRMTLAGLYSRIGRDDLALQTLESAARLGGGNPEVFFSLGQLYQKKQDFGKSLAAFRRAVELSPKNNAYRLTLGLSYDQFGDSARALEQFREAMNTNPKDPSPHYYAGQILERQGLHIAALQEYQAALNLQPNSSTFRAAVKKLE